MRSRGDWLAPQYLVHRDVGVRVLLDMPAGPTSDTRLGSTS